MFRNLKTLLFVLFILTIAGAAYAFAANNTFAPTNAGFGTTTISGYAIDDVVYDLDDADPKMVNQITFTITGNVPPVTVKINVAEEASWKDCSIYENNVTCLYEPTIPLASIVKLDVVASSSINPIDIY